MSVKENIINFKNRLPERVKLVAVSKTKPNSLIMEAYETGQRIFGENKVQDLAAKQPELPVDIKWHFIGHLQRNKVKFIAPFVDTIHAIDSLKLYNRPMICTEYMARRNNSLLDIFLI